MTQVQNNYNLDYKITNAIETDSKKGEMSGLPDETRARGSGHSGYMSRIFAIFWCFL